MAKFSDLKSAMDRAIRAITSDVNMRRIGQVAADMIKTRTKLGYGVKDEGSKRDKLDELSEDYIEQRKRERKRGSLSTETTAARSNLTRTGQMLNSIKVKKVQNGAVTVGPEGRRSDGLKNEDVAGFVSENGRPFNNLSDIELKRVQEEIRDNLDQILQRELTKVK